MGLPPDPGFERLEGELTIVGAPPSWFDGHSVPANTHFVQPVEPDPTPGESIAAVLDDEDQRPLVYVTFGTAFNTPDLFQTVFDAVADLDVRAIATIGMNNDAADLAVPGNVRTVPFLSQGLILDHADLVVAHGGYGSLTGALRRGLPVLSLPLSPPDNRFNAAQLVKLGAGLALGTTSDQPRRYGNPSNGYSTTASTETAQKRSPTRSLAPHSRSRGASSSSDSRPQRTDPVGHWLLDRPTTPYQRHTSTPADDARTRPVSGTTSGTTTAPAGHRP